jgi:hypothetical protein
MKIYDMRDSALPKVRIETRDRIGLKKPFLSVMMVQKIKERARIRYEGKEFKRQSKFQDK